MIGERLSEIRKDHGDTQARLAKRLNVSLPTVRSWEQGKSSPGHDMLVEICKIYKVSADYLLGLTNNDPVYTKHIRLTQFSDEELMEIHSFEEYIISKRKNKAGD